MATTDRPGIVEEIDGAAHEARAGAREEREALRELGDGTDPAGLTDGTGRRRLLAACLLGVLLAALTALNLAGYGPLRLTRQPPSPAETDHMLRSTLYMAVMEIEAYRRTAGALPGQFADLKIQGSGSWIYEPLGRGNYTLTFSDGKRRVTYISTRSPEVFFAGLALLGPQEKKP